MMVDADTIDNYNVTGTLDNSINIVIELFNATCVGSSSPFFLLLLTICQHFV